MACRDVIQVILDLRLYCISEEDFIQNHLNIHQPCIIRNCLNNLSISHWTLSYLQEKCGDNFCDCRVGTSSDAYKQGTAYSIKSIQLKKYIQNILAENEESKNCYLAVQNIKHALPQLKNELEIPKYIQNLHSGPFLWIAPQGHYEYMHVDPDEGMLMILKGRKTVKLFSPKDFLDMQPHKLGSLGRTIQSNIDMRRYNFDSPPEILNEILPNKTCLHGELSDNDILYIPAFYWHQINTVETTISMNSFWGPNDPILFCENLLSQKCLDNGANQAFIYWFHNILEQNKNHSNTCSENEKFVEAKTNFELKNGITEKYTKKFIRQLSRLDECCHYFLCTQWKQKLNEELIQQVTEIAKNYYSIENLSEKFEDDTSKFPPLFKIQGLKLRPRVKVPGCKY